MTDPVRFTARPELREPAVIVGWSMDAGRLGTRVTDYLIRKLGAERFCEIEPVDFFPLGGVAIFNDLVLFPESRFHADAERNVVVFRSAPPGHDGFRFLSLMLDVIQDYCHAREVYTVGSMIAFGPHTAPRQLFGTVNAAELKQELSEYGLTREVDYETPAGGRPTLNSFFLWAAKKRGITGANLWVPVPFYLVSGDDVASHRKPIEFLNRRLGLGLDLSDLDEQEQAQGELIGRMRATLPEVDRAIRKLEDSVRLAEGEGEKLAAQAAEFLSENQP